MKSNGHIIREVRADSIAAELELSPGDAIIEINGTEIEDIFDYEYLVQDEYIELLVKTADGEEWLLEIEKEYDEELGIVFENGLMDEYRSCRNKCIFCFIDQMPPGMRKTLYFKDDDSRLSFLQGNYVTLTNMSDKDIGRIIKYKLSPINISVHATNPELRCKMLKNRFAGAALEKIDQLYQAETPMNGQIVLCKGVNDGEELRRSIQDLMKYQPYMESVSVVPVGITKFRDGLFQMDPFTKADAAAVINLIEAFQQESAKRYGSHFIHASDEFYIMAEREFPEEERYDGYIQLENGVGMLRLLLTEIEQALTALHGDSRARKLMIATGKLAGRYIRQAVAMVRQKFPEIEVEVFEVANRFFGEQITVSGLITGQDLLAQLSGRHIGQALLLPENMFRSGEEVFLDDITRGELQNALQVPVIIVKSSGQDFVEAVTGSGEDGYLPILDERAPSYNGYELKEI